MDIIHIYHLYFSGCQSAR